MVTMGKYLAIYNGGASDEQKQAISLEQQQAFMQAWGEWAKIHESALVDPGAPLFRKRVVTSDNDTEFTDTKTGYAIVEADSHDAAVAIFATHPHLTLDAGNSIEVIECPSIPALAPSQYPAVARARVT
jgi:zona occludens toxin (predicted ATPase)